MEPSTRTQHDRANDPVGALIGSVGGLAELLGLDYLTTGGISDSYMHQLDGLMLQLHEIAEVQSVIGNLLETAKFLQHEIDHPSTLPCDEETARLRELRVWRTAELKDALGL